MGTDRVIISALAATLAAGAFCFASTAADVGRTPEPATIAEPAPAGPAATTPFTAPRYFNPTRPREDNPTNPPGTWEVYPSPTTRHLYCVDFIDENNGWAGGGSVALRYANGTWTEIPGHSGHVFEDMDVLSANDGWAVGWDGNKELPAIWRWDGSDWKEFQNPTGGVNCIDMIDAAHGWIGGVNYFLRYNGYSWVYGGSAPHNVFGIQMNSDTDGRAVGYQFIMRRTGNNWTQEVSNNEWYLSCISMLNNNYGLACGQYRPTDKGLIVFYNGSWRTQKIFENSRFIPNLDFYNLNFGWCVGRKSGSPPYGSFIAFYDGNGWLETTSPTNNGLTDVTILSRGIAWAVGLYGTLLKYKPNLPVSETSLGKIKGIYH